MSIATTAPSPFNTSNPEGSLGWLWDAPDPQSTQPTLNSTMPSAMIFANITDSNLIHIFNYDVCLPIYAFGIIINGAIILAAAISWKRTIITRLDRLLIYLTIVFAVWCLLSTIRPLVELSNSNLFPENIVQFYTSMFLMLIFGINLLISMERYFTIAETSPEENKTSIGAAIFTWLLLCISLVVDFFYAPRNVGPRVLYSWFTVVSPASMVAILFSIMTATCGIYAATFFASTRKIRKSLANRWNGKFDVELIRAKLERKILWSCLIMSASLVICYLPIFMVTLVALNKSNGDMTAALLFSNLMVCLDVIVSPALVLYFMPNLRKTMFSVLQRRQSCSEEGV
ncbi:hypothetical protein BCR33DRAFT_719440 [Rhizoclosmatium globosum]|uniref:G-protein coupled receptors family 1 profile domain-containing protein n=1 Tax=Rhizoclosmatium globosum TaxID=329046 RepID=A0A1Y2C2B6_9FUNG|nr:hypothetical protein BCR33DRAFT_719440 [Rhizoclosmatium globosum]|eukprot:ORY40455.1 hypothetical protein BCR33DRAFT_719440 [Rhizoclosmatium globosum]